jgi:hypothetical protein
MDLQRRAVFSKIKWFLCSHGNETVQMQIEHLVIQNSQRDYGTGILFFTNNKFSGKHLGKK